LQGVVPRGLVVVVVVGGGRAPERVLPIVVVAAVATTFRKAMVVVMVMVKGKMMIRIRVRFLGLVLDPGRLKAMSNRERVFSCLDSYCLTDYCPNQKVDDCP